VTATNSALRLPLRPLGHTGLEVTPLGLAAMSMGTSGRGQRLSADDVERAYHEHGINTFLVHFMMKGMCEGVRRLIQAGHRDRLVLVSEVGFPFAGSVRRGLEKHLRLLGTDHLDLWLLGWVIKRWYARGAVWSEMQRLREAGKVRAIGFSSHNRPLAATLARDLPADVIMIRYNAAHRGAEREIFAPLADLGANRPGVIAYTATRWNMLLRPLPKRGFPRAMTGAECYRFVLGQPMVDTVWCGARTPAELREDVEGALAGPLDAARLDEVRRFGDAVHAAAHGGWRWMFGRDSQ
jgi:aryl-alcohol dehydrogenase-like predicted oxidoreductase